MIVRRTSISGMSVGAASHDGTSGGRSETENERLDRNWSDILQELRVTQTGTQILTGFLLAIAFQPRFAELSEGQIAVYLALVVTAAVSTVLSLAPVSLHRVLFRRGLKNRIVRVGNSVIGITLVLVSITVTGTAYFIVDVVAGAVPGIFAGLGVGLCAIVTWLVIPILLRRDGHQQD